MYRNISIQSIWTVSGIFEQILQNCYNAFSALVDAIEGHMVLKYCAAAIIKGFPSWSCLNYKLAVVMHPS